MHYYQFNIGDYASHTRHLSLLEDLAYRKLLDQYYLQEHPLNACSTSVARLIGMREHQTEVDAVLNDFFTLTDEGWVQIRADREIEHYKNKQEQASKAGKASALKRTFNGRSTDVQPNSKQETVNSKQVKSKALSDKSDGVLFLEATSKPKQPDAEQVLSFLNLKASRGYRPVAANIKLIEARLKDGYTVQDMKAVIAMKCRTWGGDAEKAEFLRPKTLFNATNFANYHGQLAQQEAA